MFVCLLSLAQCVDPPAPYGAVPVAGQLAYHREELSAFIHYGMNTYTGVEWGTGKEDTNWFKPTNLDTDQWVRTLKEAGFQRIIMIGRHHDGFCLWKSKYTEHDVENSAEFQETSKKLGQSGDVILELSKSCTKYDMNMGFYLSPWDANSPDYGKEVEYNEYYMNQLEEIIGDPKYGNNGKFVEVWMDGAKGTGAADQKYWFDKWFELIERLQPGAVVFSPYGSTIRWIGTESGKAGDPCWSKLNKERQRKHYDETGGDEPAYLNTGDPEGDIWSVGECDVSLTSGWFWKEGKVPKSMAELCDIYFSSVGHGQPLLLNVPPNKEGKMPDDFVARTHEFGLTVRNTFQTNMAFGQGVTATASSERGPEYAASNVLNDNTDKYWTMADSELTGTLEIDLGKMMTFDVISISEHIPLGQRVINFKTEVHTNSGWSEHAQSNTIGAKRLIRSYPVTADKIRFTFTKCYAVPVIESVGVFKAYGAFAMGDGFPAELTEVDYTQIEKSGGWNEEESAITTDRSGAFATLKFKGSMCWVSGTVDPKFGNMNVYIDDQKVDTVSLQGGSHEQRQKLFGSSDLAFGEHTLKVEAAENKKIAIHSFYYLGNDGVGMFELESANYYVKKGESVTLKVKRVGGTTGKTTVTFQTAPDTAVHGRHYRDITVDLTFADGESVKEVTVETINHTEVVGNLTFYGQIVDPKNGAILGFNSSSVITIIPPASVAVSAAKVEKKNYVPIIVGVCAGIACVALVVAFFVIRARRAVPAEEFATESLLSQTPEAEYTHN